MKKIIDYIKENKEYSFEYFEHLSKLYDDFEDISPTEMGDNLDLLVDTEWKKLFKFMVEYRKAINCSLCNYED